MCLSTQVEMIHLSSKLLKMCFFLPIQRATFLSNKCLWFCISQQSHSLTAHCCSLPLYSLQISRRAGSLRIMTLSMHNNRLHRRGPSGAFCSVMQSAISKASLHLYSQTGWREREGARIDGSVILLPSFSNDIFGVSQMSHKSQVL